MRLDKFIPNFVFLGKHRRKGNKYDPHQGDRERERRRIGGFFTLRRGKEAEEEGATAREEARGAQAGASVPRLESRGSQARAQVQEGRVRRAHRFRHGGLTLREARRAHLQGGRVQEAP